MFTVKRSATAAAALAVLLTACGGAGGDVTATDSTNDAGPTPTQTPPEQTPEPSEPSTASPEATAEPRETTPPPDDSGSDQTQPPEDTGGSESGEPATELTVNLDPGNGDASEWTITCDPVGGTAGDPEAACETLDTLTPQDVAPVPRDANCTMQYGGPQTARVTGIWDGTKVDLSFSRQNGCEIARWDAMESVLPAGDGALR